MDMLKIKLSAAVDDISLKKLDEVKLKVEESRFTGDSAVIEVRPSSSETGRIAGDGYFTNASLDNLGKTQNPLDLYPRIIKGDYYFFIGRKQYLKDIRLGTNPVYLDLSELSYCPAMEHIEARTGTIGGDVAYLANVLENFKLLDLRSSLVYGDVSVFARCREMTDLRLISTKCNGVLDVGHCTNLAVLVIEGSGGITCDFDDIADSMVENGRISGSLSTVDAQNNRVTYTFDPEAEHGWTKT